LVSGKKYSAEDLEGPSEIVLWKDFDDLLEEVDTITGEKKTKKAKKSKKAKK
jgi:hypothetical protein